MGLNRGVPGGGDGEPVESLSGGSSAHTPSTPLTGQHSLLWGVTQQLHSLGLLLSSGGVPIIHFQPK